MSQVRALYGPQPFFLLLSKCLPSALERLCVECMVAMIAYLSDLKHMPLVCFAEARAERQMAEVEERQRKLADLAESALTEVSLNQHALLLHHSASCGVMPMSSMRGYPDVCH